MPTTFLKAEALQLAQAVQLAQAAPSVWVPACPRANLPRCWLVRAAAAAGVGITMDLSPRLWLLAELAGRVPAAEPLVSMRRCQLRKPSLWQRAGAALVALVGSATFPGPMAQMACLAVLPPSPAPRSTCLQAPI